MRTILCRSRELVLKRGGEIGRGSPHHSVSTPRARLIPLSGLPSAPGLPVLPCPALWMWLCKQKYIKMVWLCPWAPWSSLPLGPALTVKRSQKPSTNSEPVTSLSCGKNNKPQHLCIRNVPLILSNVSATILELRFYKNSCTSWGWGINGLMRKRARRQKCFILVVTKICWLQVPRALHWEELWGWVRNSAHPVKSAAIN